jgi:hypothetical protein
MAMDLEKLKTAKIGDAVDFGPHTWKVLDERANAHSVTKLLLASDVTDMRPYHSDVTDVSWAECNMRAWLNKEFLNRFSGEELALIRPTRIVTANPWWTEMRRCETEDHAFILGLEDVVASCETKELNDKAEASANQDGPDLGDGSNALKEMLEWLPRGFQKEGLSFERDGYLKGDLERKATSFLEWDIDIDERCWEFTPCRWWLRTPAKSYHAMYVLEDGRVQADIGYTVDEIFGVRPALWIEL